MKDRKIKYCLIESGLFDTYSKFRYVEYLYTFKSNVYQGLPDTQKAYLSFGYEFNNLPTRERNSLIQLYESKIKKTQRLKKRIKQMLMYNCIFLTLTFTDEVLQNTSSNSRRVYVARYLKSQRCLGYVANIDFGQNDNFTKREHYHALIVCDSVDLKSWSYGIINAERVHKANAGALSKYINKFTSHAYKEGASSSRLIFSRNFSTSFDLDRLQKGIFQHKFC